MIQASNQTHVPVTSPAHFEALSIWDEAARQKAVQLIKEGEAVGVFNRGVCAIWIDGSNQAAVEKVYAIKGEQRIGKTMAATFDMRQFASFVDQTKIAVEHRDLFTFPQQLCSRLGSLCFLRVPITAEAASQLPSIMVSASSDNTSYWLQNWEPRGHLPARLLIEAMQQQGVAYPAVTSMNVSGQSEIVLQEEGAEFTRMCGLPLFLCDPNDKAIVQGSYPILSFDNQGVHLVRQGHIADELFSPLLHIATVDTSSAIPTKYAHPSIPTSLIVGHNSYRLRSNMIAYFNGHLGR